MHENGIKDDYAILIVAVILLATALAATTLTFPEVHTHQNINSSAYARIKISAPAYSVENFKLEIYGNGVNESQSLRLGPNLYLLNRSAAGVPASLRGPIIPNSTTNLGNLVAVPQNKTDIFVANLKPHSLYTIEITGSESPYCFPGVACPMFILGISDLYSFQTGANGSTTNFSISLYPFALAHDNFTQCNYAMQLE